MEEKSDPAAAAAVAVADIRAVEEKSDPVAAPAVAVVAYIRVAVVEAYAYLLVDIVVLRAVYSSPNCVVVAATADSSFVLPPPVVGAAAVRVALWTWHHQTVAGSDSAVAVRLVASASRVVARGHVVWSRRRFHRTVKDSEFAWLRRWRNRTGRDPDLDSVSGSVAVVVREEDRRRWPWHQTGEDWDFGARVPRFHHQTVKDWDCSWEVEDAGVTHLLLLSHHHHSSVHHHHLLQVEVDARWGCRPHLRPHYYYYC